MTGHAYVPCLPHSLEQLGFLNRLIGPGSEYTVFFVHSDENRAEKMMSEFLSHPRGDAYAPNTRRTAHTTCPRFPGLQARGSGDALSRPRFQRPGEMIPFQRGTNADVVTQDVHNTIRRKWRGEASRGFPVYQQGPDQTAERSYWETELPWCVSRRV